MIMRKLGSHCPANQSNRSVDKGLMDNTPDFFFFPITARLSATHHLLFISVGNTTSQDQPRPAKTSQAKQVSVRTQTLQG